MSASSDVGTEARHTRLCSGALLLPFPDANSGPEGPLTREAVGADDGTRTRDPHLGKVMLYQLSHVRESAQATKAAGDGHR